MTQATIATDLLDDVGFVPKRVPAVDHDMARHLLETEGAVVLGGLPVATDSLVLAAAHVLGSRLRQLFPVRKRGSGEGGKVALHTDNFNVVVDMAGTPTRLRDPNEDYVLVQSAKQASTGGDSVVADAYLLVDRIREHDPELYRFLTGTDVDLYGAWVDRPGVPKAPYVCRHLEWTRTGRRVARLGGGAQPLPRDPDPEWITSMYARYLELADRLFDRAPRILLDEGEILLLDNYRCWHGRDPHVGERMVYILTLCSDQAM